VYYKCTSIHAPEAERAVLYNDPDVAIDWPLEPAIISQKDKDAPRFKDAEYNF
jgi:dTDP-4-dehydrorhamnose 3,5-epimerase